MYRNVKDLSNKEIGEVLTNNYQAFKGQLSDFIKAALKVKSGSFRINVQEAKLKNIYFEDQVVEGDTLQGRLDRLKETFDFFKEGLAGLDINEDMLSPNVVSDIEEINDFISQMEPLLRNIATRIESADAARQSGATEKVKVRREIVD